MKNRDLTNAVFNTIRDRILRFELLPGVKISDKEIAESMQISRSPVRQALFRLAEHGLVETKYNRGFIVKLISAKEVEDLHVLREALEVRAIDLVIENLTDDTADRFNAYVEGLKPLIEKNDVPGITEIDWAFHNLIIETSQNTLMIDFFRTLQDRIKISFPHLQTPGSTLWEIYKEHKEIADNILYRNPDGAKYAISKHIMDALTIRLDSLKQRSS
jgi:DNA-binding GntR family transcriptional regulator